MGLSIKQNIEYNELPSELKGRQTTQPLQTTSIINSEISNGCADELQYSGETAATNVYDGVTITYENGKKIYTETLDGEVIKKTIQSEDPSGNLTETIVSYSGGKPINKIEKKNGNTIAATKFTYHSGNESEAEYVTLETDYPDRTSVKTNVLSTDEYGNYDEADFISETITKPNGTITETVFNESRIVETQTKFDGTVTETVYNGSDLNKYKSGNLNKLTQTVTQNGSSTTVQYDDNGNRLETTKTDGSGLKVDIETVKKEAEEQGITNIEVTEDNAELLHAMLTARDTDGDIRFCEADIKKLLAQSLDEGKITELMQMKNIDGSYRFTGYEISKLLNKNLDYGKVMKFVNMKDSNENFRFNGWQIARLLNGYYDYNMVVEYTKIENLNAETIFSLLEMRGDYPQKYNEITDAGLLELIDSGYITKEKCSQLFRISAGINEHTSFSERTLSEIRLMKEQSDAGQTPSLVREVPQNASADWIFENIKEGDVYEQDGMVFVYEKGCSIKLNMTKDKFDELFPPLSSSFTQGRLADCWLVSAIDNMMDKPQGRAAIFQMFEQDGDDILVKIPEGEKPVKFKNGEVFDNYGKQISGDKGIKMLEQAYAVHRQNHYDDTSLSVFEINESTDVSGLIQELSWGYTGEAWGNLTGKISYVEDIFKKAAKYIEKNANSPEVMIAIGFSAPPETQTVGSGETVIDESYHLYGNHAYAIKGYDHETKMVYLTNPWNTSTVTEVPMEMIKNHFGRIEIMEFPQ